MQVGNRLPAVSDRLAAEQRSLLFAALPLRSTHSRFRANDLPTMPVEVKLLARANPLVDGQPVDAAVRILQAEHGHAVVIGTTEKKVERDRCRGRNICDAGGHQDSGLSALPNANSARSAAAAHPFLTSERARVPPGP